MDITTKRMLLIFLVALIILGIVCAYNGRLRTSYPLTGGAPMQFQVTARRLCFRNMSAMAVKFSKLGVYQTDDDANSNRGELLNLPENKDGLLMYTIGSTTFHGSAIDVTTSVYDQVSLVNYVWLLPNTALVVDFGRDVSFGSVRLGTFSGQDMGSFRLKFETSAGEQPISSAAFRPAYLVFQSGDTQNNQFINSNGSHMSSTVYSVSAVTYIDRRAAEVNAAVIAATATATANAATAAAATNAATVAAAAIKTAADANAAAVAATNIANVAAANAAVRNVAPVQTFVPVAGTVVRLLYTKDRGITAAQNASSIGSGTSQGDGIFNFSLKEDNKQLQNVLFKLTVDCALLPTKEMFIAEIKENGGQRGDPGILYKPFPNGGGGAQAIASGSSVSGMLILPKTGTAVIAYVSNQSPGSQSSFKVDPGVPPDPLTGLISTTTCTPNWSTGIENGFATFHSCVLSATFLWSDSNVFTYP